MKLSLTAEGKDAGLAGLLAAGVTVVTWFVVAIVLGVVAAGGSRTLTSVFLVLLTGLPAGLGAMIGSRRAVTGWGRGTVAAVIGFAGSTVISVLLAGAGLVSSSPTSPIYTVIMPLLGAAAGAWLGGIREPAD